MNKIVYYLRIKRIECVLKYQRFYKKWCKNRILEINEKFRWANEQLESLEKETERSECSAKLLELKKIAANEKRYIYREEIYLYRESEPKSDTSTDT